MKNYRLPIVGTVLFVVGFCLATGIEQEPIMALWSAGCMIAAAIAFNKYDAMANTKHDHVRYRKAA